MNDRTLTVSRKWLTHAAAQIETAAKESKIGWFICGKSSRYTEEMEKAAVLRRAAEIKSVSRRREYLRNNGFEA